MEDNLIDRYFLNDETDKSFVVDDFNDTLNSDDSLDASDDETKDNESKDTKDKDDDDETGPILDGIHRFDKKFICIRYPGNVVNSDKAIETLGGLPSISTAVNNSKRRLELRFRPADGYCKAACGDRHAVSGFLLRIRIKKSRIHQINKSTQLKDTENQRDLVLAHPWNKNNDKNVRNVVEIHPTTVNNTTDTRDSGNYDDVSCDRNYELPKLKVLGQVTTEFRFTGLADFQYLPIVPSVTNATKNICIYESIYPVGIPPRKWLDNNVPYFLPPAAFSRMDSVQYLSMKTEARDLGSDGVPGTTRKSRGKLYNFIYFDTTTIPTNPPADFTKTMLKDLNKLQLEQIAKLFEKRPIWSRHALRYNTGFTSDQLRSLLPAVAYYFIEGPWRAMWVRLGYDPRFDPSARIYQTLDWRLKSMHGLEQNVKGKRTYTNYILPYKSASMAKPKGTVLTNMEEEEEDEETTRKDKNYDEDVYIYRDGVVPPWKQMFYQYCDVLADEIQEMLNKLPEIPAGPKCHKKRGWLPSGFGDQCREIINRQVKVVLRKQMNIPDNYPTTLPRDKGPGLSRRRNPGIVPSGKKDKKLSSSPKKNDQNIVDSDAD